MAEQTCMWSLNTDDEFGMYETSCKQAFVFNDGTPKDNEFRFCCYCGKALEMNHYTDTDGDGTTEVLGPVAGGGTAGVPGTSTPVTGA